MKPFSFLLTAQTLSLRSAMRTLINSLDLALEPGKVLGILGANGAGKSSLLTVLAGLSTPVAGQVSLGNQALLKLPPLMRAQHIGLLPQGDEGGFMGNVRDFVSLGRYPLDDAWINVDSHLVTWELLELDRRAFDSLSGGERQRARLAQLAVQAPQIYLLDEPLTHLDPAHQARLLAWVRAQAETGKSVVLTLHDPNWAASHCDSLLFLYGDGRWQMGTSESLLNSASLEALYGAGTTSLWQTR